MVVKAYELEYVAGVLFVVPNSYIDTNNENYGGEYVVYGKIVNERSNRGN